MEHTQILFNGVWVDCDEEAFNNFFGEKRCKHNGKEVYIFTEFHQATKLYGCKTTNEIELRSTSEYVEGCYVTLKLSHISSEFDRRGKDDRKIGDDRVCVVARNEGGYCTTVVDLEDLLKNLCSIGYLESYHLGDLDVKKMLESK